MTRPVGSSFPSAISRQLTPDGGAAGSNTSRPCSPALISTAGQDPSADYLPAPCRPRRPAAHRRDRARCRRSDPRWRCPLSRACRRQLSACPAPAQSPAWPLLRGRRLVLMTLRSVHRTAALRAPRRRDLTAGGKPVEQVVCVLDIDGEHDLRCAMIQDQLEQVRARLSGSRQREVRLPVGDLPYLDVRPAYVARARPFSLLESLIVQSSRTAAIADEVSGRHTSPARVEPRPPEATAGRTVNLSRRGPAKRRWRSCRRTRWRCRVPARSPPRPPPGSSRRSGCG